MTKDNSNFYQLSCITGYHIEDGDKKTLSSQLREVADLLETLAAEKDGGYTPTVVSITVEYVEAEEYGPRLTIVLEDV